MQLRVGALAQQVRRAASLVPRSGARGFALAPGETAEDFLASRDELLRTAGIEPHWPSAQEIRRKIEAGELGS